MYNSPVAPGIFAAGGTLAATGSMAGVHWLWITLGAFALLSAAFAASRAAPKPQA